MSKRNCATLLLITTPCSHRPSENDKDTYELSDGKTITVGAERVRYAEVLFQPSLTVRGQRIPRHFFPVLHEV